MRLLLALLTATYLVATTGCTPPDAAAWQPAPAALEAPPTVDIAAALDRIARSNEAQTTVLRELTRTLTGLEVRVAALESPPVVVAVVETASVSPVCPVSISTKPTRVVYATRYAGPQLMRGQPLRNVFRRIGSRLRQPFGGRFRRR